jgi:RNA-directed DNA polymerase
MITAVVDVFRRRKSTYAPSKCITQLGKVFHRQRRTAASFSFRYRLTGGKDKDRGTPQGGVISPLLANLYMKRMLKGWKQAQRGEQFQARIVSYADDFAILSRGKAKAALSWAQATLTRLGLTLNERKTSIPNAGKEQFDFLGYTFGPHFSRRTGREYIGCSPSKKSVNRIKEKVESISSPAMWGLGKKCGIG